MILFLYDFKESIGFSGKLSLCVLFSISCSSLKMLQIIGN
jgi:hypothetical protein